MFPRFWDNVYYKSGCRGSECSKVLWRLYLWWINSGGVVMYAEQWLELLPLSSDSTLHWRISRLTFADSTAPLQNALIPNLKIEWTTSDSGTIINMKLKTISRRGHVIARYFAGTSRTHFMSLDNQYREIVDVRKFLFKWDATNQRECNIDSDLFSSTKEVSWSVNNQYNRPGNTQPASGTSLIETMAYLVRSLWRVLAARVLQMTGEPRISIISVMKFPSWLLHSNGRQKAS